MSGSEVKVYIDQQAIDRGTTLCKLIGVETQGEYALKGGRTYTVGEADYGSVQKARLRVRLSSAGREAYRVGINPFAPERFSVWCQVSLAVDQSLLRSALQEIRLREQQRREQNV